MDTGEKLPRFFILLLTNNKHSNRFEIDGIIFYQIILYFNQKWLFFYLRDYRSH
jgi:hypothetical protein